jgi:hypothetical protein
MRTKTSRPVPRRSLKPHRALAVLAGAALLVLPVVALAAAPTVVTSAPDTTLITDTYALLSGSVNPKSTATSYFFQWGTTTDYGQTTPLTSAGNGAADVPVDVSLDGLTPRTTYHYRLVAGPTTPKDPANPEYVYGEDIAFTTAPALAAFVTGGKTPVTAQRAQVKILCDGPVDEICQGRVSLKGKAAGTVQTLGSAGYHVTVGKTKTIAVFLNLAARRALKASQTHHLLADATAKTAGSKTPATNKLILVG